jgi:hypothetical protein
MVVYKNKHKKVYNISNNFHGGYEVIALNKKDNPCLECYFDWKDYCDYNRRFSCLEKRRGHMKYIDGWEDKDQFDVCSLHTNT